MFEKNVNAMIRFFDLNEKNYETNNCDIPTEAR